MNLQNGWGSAGMQVLEHLCGRDSFHKEAILFWSNEIIRKRQEPVILKDISLSEDERQTTQIGELDRVLGGGIVPGSLVLVGGDPGIGKSTLLLQVCRNLAEKQVSVLYISGEESLRQIKLRANRIGQFTDKMQLLCETNLEVIREVIERRKPDVVVIDSIQTMFHEDVSSALEVSLR